MNKPAFIFSFVLLFSFIFFSCTDRDIPVAEEEEPVNRGFTHLSGKISGTLQKANSPFLVTEDIYVDSSNSLYIEPGVELHFEKNKGLIGYGDIFLSGTKENPISLEANDSSWKGISFEGSKESRMQFCILENTENLDASSNKSALTIINSTVEITNCIFSNNSSNSGGAINISSSTVELKNNIFRDNYAAYFAGAVLSSNSELRVINNTFFRNRCDNFAGGILLYNSNSLIENNIFNINSSRTGNNSIALGDRDSSLVISSYNFFPSRDSDPFFNSEDDLHLKINSPCRNAGNPDRIYLDFDGTRNDQGAYGGPQGDW